MITVKEEFLSHPKTQRAIKLGGWSVLGLWLALKGYVSVANTGGFIPEVAIDDLPGIPTRWEKPLQALIDCGNIKPDGSRGAGLVERVAQGYQLHDYEDHGTPPEVEDRRRQKERERKAAYRARLAAEAAAAALAAASRGQTTGQSVGTTRDVPRDSTRGGAPARDRGGARAGRAPAHPSPAQPSQIGSSAEKVDPKAAASSDMEGTPQPPQLVRCPADLELTADQITNAQMGLGLKAETLVACATEFRGRYLGKPSELRTVDQWRSGLWTMVCQSGREVQRRLDEQAKQPDPDDDMAEKFRRAEAFG